MPGAMAACSGHRAVSLSASRTRRWYASCSCLQHRFAARKEFMSAVVQSLLSRRTVGARKQAAQAAKPPGMTASVAQPIDAHQVTQPILFKRQPALAALFSTTRAAAPAAIACLSLYATAKLYGIAFTEFFSTLMALVTVLSIFLLQPPGNTAAELLSLRRSIVFGLLARWLLLLAGLVIVSYATDFSGRSLWMYPPGAILTWVLLTPLLVVIATLAIHELRRRVMCTPGNSRAAVFAGCSEAGLHLARRFAQHPELCMAVRGFFDDRSPQRLGTAQGLLGRLPELPAYVKRHGIDVIFIALPLRHIRRVHDLLHALGDTTASLYYVPDVFVSDLFEARAGEILGVPVIAMRETPFHGYRGVAKRLIDVTIASLLLVLMAPLLMSIAVGIRLTSPGPVIFRQRRYGLDGREIVVYKFRTMSVVEDSGWLTQAQRNDERVTRFGRFLRRWSLDEFPQLINVLQGRMSLVGPRPHAVAHNEEYRRLIRGYMVRHKVPPGITGLAQVNGLRGETRRLKDMQRRVQLDLQYVRGWSLWLDLKILALTVPVLFRSDRAY
jgi:Undecaprenyl-phosphate glucose phosphotransferase